MSTPPLSHSIYRFGVFEIDPRAGELRKNGIRVKVQDQPFQILLKLLQHPDKVVSREELRSALWPADTFVDFDNGLNMAMKRLREVLGDVAERPTYIETVPRHGYRFIAPLHSQSSGDETGRIPTVRLKLGIPAARWRWITVYSSCLVLLVGFAKWHFWRTVADDPPSAMEVVPLLGLTGLEGSPDFSPDGNQVAFVYGPENPGIYTAVVGGNKPLRLTSEGSDRCPTWSPDGRQIAFVRDSEDGFAIYSISALGGSERRLYSGPSNHFVRTLDWSPDGKLLSFAQTDADKTHSWIALLSLADFTTRRVTSPSTEDIDFAPAFSPDGVTLAFVRVSVSGIVSDLYIVPVAGGQPRRLTFDNRTIFARLTWAADGREIVFSSDRGGVSSLWRVAVSGGRPQPIAGVGPANYPSISRRGNQLAYVRQGGKKSFWELDLKDEKHAQNPPRSVITQTGIRPQYSPNGKTVAFQSDRLGHMEIWTCNRDGSSCGQLTFLGGHAGAPRWSPDGHYVAFEYRPKEHSEIYVVEVPGGVPRLIPTLAGSNNGGPNWSQDGKSIYFYSDRGGGRFQLWKVPFKGGSPVQLTRNGGVFAIESSDGRFVYYSKLEENGIWRIPSSGGEEARVFDQIGGLEWSDWALGQNGIYFLRSLRGRFRDTVQFYDFRNQEITPIWTLEKPAGLGLTLSTDSKSILYTQTDFWQSNIMVVKNFR